jgi:Putative beta barrel porin-7 (BBP7)
MTTNSFMLGLLATLFAAGALTAQSAALPASDDSTPRGDAAPLSETVAASGGSSTPSPTSWDPACGSVFDCECSSWRDRFWIGGDYLLWWVKPGPVPVPVATTGNPALNFAGALGQPGTSVLLGDSNLGYGATSGLRLNAGFWLNNEHTWSIEGTAFLLDNRSVHQSVHSDGSGNPPIFIPINDVAVGEDAFTVAFPKGVAGSLTLSSTSRLWGAEANIAHTWFEDSRWRVQFLGGFRHLNLDESVQIAKIADDFGGILNSPTNPGHSEPAGSIITTTDNFWARNQFYGAQFGMRAGYTASNGLFAMVTGKIALGSTHEILDIGGQTT